MTGHPADPVSVSGRDQPRPVPGPPVAHVVRFAAVITDGGADRDTGDWHVVLRPEAVIQATCDGCPGWSRTVDNGHTSGELGTLADQHSPGHQAGKTP